MKYSRILVPLLVILLFISAVQADTNTWSTSSEWSAGTYNNIDMGDSFHLADASGGSEVDYFDRTDLGPYSGDTGQASTDTSPVIQGSHSLLTSGNNDVIYSSSGLPNYPTPGDTFSVWIRSDYDETSYEGPHIYWGKDRSYSLRMRQGSVDFNGPCGTIDSTSGTNMNANTWYELEVDWQSDGDAYATIYDTNGNTVESYGGTCNTASSGSYAIGFRAGGYGNSWYDGWSIDTSSSTYETSGYVRTGYKDFGQNMDPNSFQINNFNYNLNGESVSVEVEADTGDTSDTINLGGGSSYSVSGLSDEADRYRLYISLSGDGSSTPSVSAATLEAQAANTAPDAPGNPSPADTATAVTTSPTLSVDVSDPDGDNLDVTFYNASDNSQIDTATGVSSGSTASTTWSGLNTGTSYNWYAVADDGTATTQSSTWGFTTEYEPEIDEASASPSSEVASTSPELSVDVSHQDGETMYVTFFLNGTATGSDQQVDGSGTASVQTDKLNADENYEWYVVVEDAKGYTTDNSASPWTFTTDSGNPGVNVEYGDNVNFYPDSVVLDVIPTHSHADNVDYVRLLDENGNIVDEVQKVDTNQNVSLLWEGLNHDRRYNWTAEVEHSGETAQSAEASFTTLTVGVDLLNEVNNAEKYNLYRRSGVSGENASFDSGEGDYQYIGTATSLQLIDASENLQPGDYCYVATAENLGGESSPSDEMCIEGVQVNP